MPGLDLKPGTPVPAGPAPSKARALPGEQVARRAFELDAARADVDLGIGATWHDLETTAFDGTPPSGSAMTCSPGVRRACGRHETQGRIVADVRTGSRRWIGATAGGYHDGENTLVDELAGTLRARGIALAGPRP